MSSFLNRLKEKKVLPSTPEDEKKDKLKTQAAAAPDPSASTAEQLKVDIAQTANSIIVYAQIAGVTVNDYTVTIDGEGDTVTIRGQRAKPTAEHFHNKDIENKDQEHVLEECSWGPFYRQIILPAEVDAERTEAKMRDGVLMLLLPLKGNVDRGIRIPITEVK